MSVRSESQNSNSSPRANYKSGSLSALAKSILSEQQQRLSVKHNADLDLIEDLRAFVKTRCHIETNYNQQLAKLSASHLTRKYPQSSVEADVKTLYAAWRQYLEEQERTAKERLTAFDQLASIVDQLKSVRSHKLQVSKKSLDNHFKKMCEEIIAAVSEVEKNKKLYFDEEHYAHQARDKEEKIKKRKYGILSKFTDMQSKKEKSSAQREASDIQSTQARNEYILSLVAGNAHLEQYFTYDLPLLMQTVDDGALEKVKECMLRLLESEFTNAKEVHESLGRCVENVQQTSADMTNQIFLSEPGCNCLRDKIILEFEPCENDPVATVSTEHNAALALEHELTKWISCFSKETRNLMRFEQMMQKCQNLMDAGKKTVEVSGVGNVDLEQRMDDLRQQARKSRISKCKAQARLLALREGGLSIESLEAIESNLAQELLLRQERQQQKEHQQAQQQEQQQEQQKEDKQQDKQTVRLEVSGRDKALSRTPSIRSTNISPDLGRVSAMENSSEDMGDPNETPELLSSEGDLSEDQAQQYAWNDDYNANAAWEGDSTTALDTMESTPVVDEQSLIGKRVRALYPYTAQNDDELNLVEFEELHVESADEKDWVKATNANGQTGYIPVAYVEMIEADTVQSDESLTVDETQWTCASYSGEYTSVYTSVYTPEDGKQAPNESYEAGEQGQTWEEPDQTVPKVSDQPTEGGEEYATALYDYVAASEEEISFQEGDQIRVISKSDDGWWVGEKDGQTGHFPSMLVQHADEDEEEEDEASDLGEEKQGSTERSPVDSEKNVFSEPPALPPVPPPSFAPPKPACLTPHSVVIIQPTPEVEHKSFVEEENKTEEKATKESDLPPLPPPPPPRVDSVRSAPVEAKESPPAAEVESCVEINVYESGPQRTSFSSEEDDEEEDRRTAIHVLPHQGQSNETIESGETQITSPEETPQVRMSEFESSPLPPEEGESKFESFDLPPPPIDLTLPIEEEEEEEDEDEQLIVKKLKQLKDENNNFTSSFDYSDFALETREPFPAISRPKHPPPISKTTAALSHSTNTTADMADTPTDPAPTTTSEASFANFEANFDFDLK